MELSVAKSSSNGADFQIPALAEWVDTFHQETAQLELSEILGEYSLVDLQALNALPDAEMRIFERTEELLNELNHEKEIVRKKLSDYIGQAEKTVSKIDAAFGPNGSLEEELQILSDAFNKVRNETIEKHQKRLGEIGRELSEITINYNTSRSSRPSNA
jgi:peptidoglycan hydrolase CwlO-like protein